MATTRLIPISQQLDTYHLHRSGQNHHRNLPISPSVPGQARPIAKKVASQLVLLMADHFGSKNYYAVDKNNTPVNI